jgi:hypothetical protein
VPPSTSARQGRSTWNSAAPENSAEHHLAAAMHEYPPAVVGLRRRPLGRPGQSEGRSRRGRTGPNRLRARRLRSGRLTPRAAVVMRDVARSCDVAAHVRLCRLRASCACGCGWLSPPCSATPEKNASSDPAAKRLSPPRSRQPPNDSHLATLLQPHAALLGGARRQFGPISHA